MLALKDECTRDGKQYILQAFGGKQSSPEGHCGGRQVVFVMEFAVSATGDGWAKQLLWNEGHEVAGHVGGLVFLPSFAFLFTFRAALIVRTRTTRTTTSTRTRSTTSSR